MKEGYSSIYSICFKSLFGERECDTLNPSKKLDHVTRVNLINEVLRLNRMVPGWPLEENFLFLAVDGYLAVATLVN